MKTTFTSSVIPLFTIVTAAVLLAAPSTRGAVLADSAAQFSGVQGDNGWYNGYRNLTADAAGTNYDPVAHFILFAGGEGAGAWDGATQFWTGSAWDLNTAGAAPWTFIAQTNIHPNGLNNVNEHWAIRRWTGDQLDSITPVAVTWFMRKQSAGGNGVSGGIYTNGVRVDWTAIAGTNTAGVTRTYYINAHFGMYLDLVLGPVGPDGVNNDGSDGSFNWMIIDNTIPAVPRQPDGSIFIPHNAPDTDADGLPDIWENAYVGNLTRLNAATDDDGDGSNETQEFQRSTDPTDTDTDNDGLTDGVETNTGTFVDATNTGTNPRIVDTDGDGRGDGAELTQAPFSNPTLADTDGDGFSDGSEVSTGHNPNDPGHNPNTTWIAHSQTEFSGVQGQGDLYYGYRNVTLDAAGLTSYDPTNHFIPFPEGSFTGSLWDLNTAATGPWTELGAEATHPNGVNSAPNQEHWTIRRWIANEITNETPLTLIWHMRKSNLNGSASNGVTGGIFINGRIADSATILYNNGVGITRRYYVNAKPGDIIDLILSPRGFDNISADGADGSANRLVVDTAIPPNPVQPDGTPFVPATSPDNDFDNLPDAWEMVYFPGDLTRLSAAGDFDNDGLNDRGEFLRDSNPTIADTDGDGLLDRVETNTGTFVDANDTGTNPRSTDSDADGISDSSEVNGTPRTNPNRSDTDSDGFSDPVELAEGTNPNDPADNPLTFVIAASDREFSGVQGSNNWFNGYRNYTADGGAADYDPTAHFIPYEGGEGLGPWGAGQYWNGGGWDLNTGGSGPWTSQGAQATHPNGVNSAPNQEHWAIRRWVAATELTNPTPVAIIWRVWKGNASGAGVSGAIHIDGRHVDGIAIAGNNTTNPVRRIYVDLDITNIIDLAITPVGPTGDRGDGADGSSTWFWVDTRLPREPRQPDGSLFIPASSPDSDSDGLADFWERIYADNLTTFAGTGDNDGDGLNNAGELQRDSNPLTADTDGDGLSDNVETKTGTFVSASNTGTNPRRADTDGDGISDAAEINGNPSTNPNLADTDGDGFSDLSEINSGHNPNDPSNNPNTTSLANSFAEFSGVQGQDNWYYGYRDFTADGGGASYDPVAHFIEFPPTTFTGSLWDLNTGASAPWTEIGAEASHPNGPSPVHWTIRRWLPATEITEETPVALKWLVRKSNTGGGNGVTGGVYINGERIDSVSIAGTDGVGSNRTYYVVLRPTDVVDLIHTPTGADGDHSDAQDGSFLRLLVDTAIPPNPRQPDGTPFTGLSPQLLTPVYNNAAGTVTLRWRSRAGQTYAVDASPDLVTWTPVANNVASAGAETSHVDTLPTPRPARRFYRIREL